MPGHPTYSIEHQREAHIALVSSKVCSTLVELNLVKRKRKGLFTAKESNDAIHG
jgi:hypothetical protein